MPRHRQTTGSRRRLPRAKLITALVAGGLLLAGAVSLAQVSSAGDRPSRQSTVDLSKFPALATAARIPNDQGLSPACTGRPAAPVAAGAAPQAGVQALRGTGTVAPTSCQSGPSGPVAADFLDITQVAPNTHAARPGQSASTGTFESACGRNENNHVNAGNFIVAPGVTNGAHQVNEYVGNLSANGLSTDNSLAAAGTTCRQGDQSTYFWPALRQRGTVGTDRFADDGGKDGNVGRIIRPSVVRLEFRGNDTSAVVGMPRFLKMITGDAKATTNGPANAKAQWTCTGHTDRVTAKYPLCPAGSQVQRILTFPSCWDAVNTDSANHRAHIIFPDQTGACPTGTRAVPALRMTLTYSVANGQSFSLDSFPDQLHNPLTDHAAFANLMPERLMSTVVDCINRGQRC